MKRPHDNLDGTWTGTQEELDAAWGLETEQAQHVADMADEAVKIVRVLGLDLPADDFPVYIELVKAGLS